MSMGEPTVSNLESQHFAAMPLDSHLRPVGACGVAFGPSLKRRTVGEGSFNGPGDNLA
jgi:hypothetical protein